MMCERALSRKAKGELLSNLQMVQQDIADSYIQLKQFRLGPVLNHFAELQHQDFVSLLNGLQAMRDQNSRSIVH